MGDKLTKKQRSYCMSKIRASDTSPENIVKLNLDDFEYQPKVFGKPDFINCREKIVLFIDGCFWHKCPIHFKEPKSNKEYWPPKLERNAIRDKEVNIAYKNAGWKVIRFWEHEFK